MKKELNREEMEEFDKAFLKTVDEILQKQRASKEWVKFEEDFTQLMQEESTFTAYGKKEDWD